MALAGREKSMSFVWFLLSAGLLVLTAWYVYDETVGRRTWKYYAEEWTQLEEQRIQKEIVAAQKEIKPEKMKQIQMDREKLQFELESPEFQALKAEVAEKKVVLDRANQNLQFAKADQDEIFYLWKHALHEGHGHEDFQKQYQELETKIQGLNKVQVEAENSLAESQAKVTAVTEKLSALDAEEAQIKKKTDLLEKQLKAAKERGDPIEQYVLPDLGKFGPVIWGTVDRCTSCHIATFKPGYEKGKNPFKTHPHLKEIFTKHPPEQFGCVTCHGGQGEATQIDGEVFGPGDYAHGFSKHWLNPLLRGDFIQSSCNKCHVQQWKVDLAPVYNLGKHLFVNVGCVNCHSVEGLEWAPKIGPDLSKIREKVYPEWMLGWVRKPTSYLPLTRMPQSPWKDDKEIIQAMAYILDSSVDFNWKYGKFGGGDAAQGKEFFNKVGCIACHTLEGKGGVAGPALDRIAEKTSADWIYNWIREPKNWSHVAKMPSLRLTPDEASNLTAYLITHGEKPAEDQQLRTALKDPANVKAGFGVISTYGCYACHNIKGFENMSKPSVELTNFGRKDVHELAFGDAKIDETWEAWTNGKLKNPQAFLDERSTSFMPKPNVTDDERHALLVFLKGQRPERLPEKYRAFDPDIEGGRRMVNRYNCQACHVIEGEGQEVAKFISDPNFLPPNLATTGMRLQTDWMFGFLKNPGDFGKVRTWLDIRMPTFGFSDEEAQTLVKYFKKLDKVNDLLEKEPHIELTPEELSAAQKLTSADNFNCYSCHLGGPQTPAGGPSVYAPAFQLAHDRLRPQWINKWVRNPSDMVPGTRMPGFYPEPGTGPKDILSGDDEKQIEALVDYVMTRGEKGQTVAAPAEFPLVSDTMTPGTNVPAPPPAAAPAGQN